MRISDWSSDVCSSDLRDALRDRYASLEFEQVPAEILAKATERNTDDAALMRFLVVDLASLRMSGKDNLFKRAGLPARGPVVRAPFFASSGGSSLGGHMCFRASRFTQW